MKVTTAERLKQIMAERNIRQVEILNRCKPYCKEYNMTMGRSDLSQYVSGKFTPGQRKLAILALALNVSEAWLMGYDVPMERIIHDGATLSEQEILTAYRKASPEIKAVIERILKE